MDSLILTIGLITIIVFVRYDLMLFATLTGVLLVLFVIIKGLGGFGASLRSPASALKEDLESEAKDIEKAPGSEPSGKDAKDIYDDFVDFSTKERKLEEETAEQVSKGAEKFVDSAKKLFKK